MKPLAEDPCHSWDKVGLFGLALSVVIVLGIIVVGAIWGPQDTRINETLLGAISAGLVLFLRDLVNAIRTSWEEVTRSKTNEQLAASRPLDTVVPEDAKQAADQVADAANAAAGKISQ